MEKKLFCKTGRLLFFELPSGTKYKEIQIKRNNWLKSFLGYINYVNGEYKLTCGNINRFNASDLGIIIDLMNSL